MTYDGWRCPQCGGVFSPFTPRCMNCYGAIYTFVSNGSGTIDWARCANCDQSIGLNHRCVVSGVRAGGTEP